MIEAELRIKGAAAPVAVPTISPEAGRELPRTETSIEQVGDEAVIHIKATDTTAMRAAVNSYLECIRVIEDIGNLTKVNK
jgi:KEOPS complex subunit Pcc1